MKKILFALLLVVSFASTAFAVPTLQVGVSDGSGGWLLNDTTLSNPTEEDTVVTSGSSISVAGVYQSSSILQIGGQYLTAGDWSSFTDGNGAKDPYYPTQFNGNGAILVASVPEGDLATALANLTINGLSAIHSDALVSWLPNPPSNHTPAKADISDFLFFNVGNFANIADQVPDFQSPGTLFDGEIIDLALAGMGDLAWIHFDIMAIVTDIDNKSEITSNINGNPGSHDVTWKNPGGGGGGGGQGSPVPEPSTLILLGAGIAGLAIFKRKKK